MNRLVFERHNKDCIIFKNDKKQVIGRIERVRVGQWMHWCIFLTDGCYLSPGCFDEVRAMQKKLGGRK